MTGFKPIESQNPHVMWRASNEGTEKAENWGKITLAALTVLFLIATVGGTVACFKTQSTYGGGYVDSNGVWSMFPLMFGGTGVVACGIGAVACHMTTKSRQRGYKTDQQMGTAKWALVDPKTTLRGAHYKLGNAVRSEILTIDEGTRIEDKLKELEEANSVLSAYDSDYKSFLKNSTENAPQFEEDKKKIATAEATVERINKEWEGMQDGWKKQWNMKKIEETPLIVFD